MKKMITVLCISMLTIGCNKDNDPSQKDLLIGPLWVLDDVDNDPGGEYDGIAYLEIEFFSNGTYEYYLEFVGGGDESDTANWTLTGNLLDLDGDDFILQSITAEKAVFVDEDDVVLTFDAD